MKNIVVVVVERPQGRGRKVFEIAIALSIALHLLLGAAFFPFARWLRAAIPRPKTTPPPIVALSDVVTIEKRKTIPRPHPLAPRNNSVPQRPTVAPKPKAVVAPPPPERLIRREIEAKRESPQRALASNGVPRTGAAKPSRGKTEVALAPTQPRSQTSKQVPYSQQDINLMQRQFAQAIAQARQASNPLNVPTEPPAGQKRYKLQMRGIYSDLKDGEGYIEPTTYPFERDGYNYYYMKYSIVYQDGVYEEGNVPWPARWPQGVMPDIMRPGWHGPMPCPAPGYEPPSVDQYQGMKLALKTALYLCFPGKYPEPQQ